MSRYLGLGQADPCEQQVDAEIAALENYQKLQRAGQPAQVVTMAKQFYDAAKMARENCRRQAGMQVQIVVQPGATREQTVVNIQQEATRREAAGDMQTAQRLTQTATEIKNLPTALRPASTPGLKAHAAAPSYSLQPMYIQAPATGSNTLLIAGGAVLLLLIVVLAMR